MVENITTTIPQTQFATLAIGATAQRMGITDTELFNRLKRQGLVRRLLFDCYDTLHTETIDGVVWNMQEALKNWEDKDEGGVDFNYKAMPTSWATC